MYVSIRLLRVMVCALPNSYFRTTGMELKRYSPSATARSMAVWAAVRFSVSFKMCIRDRVAGTGVGTETFGLLVVPEGEGIVVTVGIAVSYTHLDVYKRQVHMRALSM